MNPFQRLLATWRFAIFAVSALLQFPVHSISQDAAEKRPAQGCVWKMSDGDNTVYLAGSVHLLRETDYPLPAVYDLAYADSESVVFEIDMADLTGVSGAMEMQRLGSYSEDESLKDNISQETFDRIVDYFASRKHNIAARQMSPAVIDRFKPGMIFLTISSIETQNLGGRPELGLEMQYFKRSKRDDKPSSGLETIAYQMSCFDAFTNEEIEALLNETLDELDEMPDLIDQIISLWHAGDYEALDKLLNEQMSEGERIRELLLTQRNENWIPRIEKALEGAENVMFLVGAAHLIGKNSVVDLLRKKGYEVERVLTGKAERKKKAA